MPLEETAESRASQLFRAEALQHHAGGGRDGELVRFDRRWTATVYRNLVVAVILSFLLISLLPIDEYASGPAVVRVEGRRVLTTAAAGAIAEVRVRPGQRVRAGELLVSLDAREQDEEQARATREFDLGLVRMLREPGDHAVKETLAGLRAVRDRADGARRARELTAELDGYVTDVRVRPGQHVAAGEIVLALSPQATRQVSLITVLSAEYRPLLHPGLKTRFELDGFRYEYADLTLRDVSDEAIGLIEVQRFLGTERADTLALAPGAKVLVSATLPSSTFTSEGRPYGYFDGLTGRAEVRVRSESLLMVLVPALRKVATWLAP